MSRIEQEKQTVEQMIRLYCRKKEGNETLCRNAGKCWNMHMHGCHVVHSEKRKVLADSVPYIVTNQGDAGTDERNHEMGRAKNVVISSGSGYPAFVAGVY